MAGVDQVDPGTQPVFTFSGNNLEWDWYGPGGPGTPSDGVVTWQEIDEASGASHNVLGVGDNDGTLDAPEYPYLSTIKFAIQGEDGSRATTFYATVQMRNKT
jgi:hypothetical protein